MSIVLVVFPAAPKPSPEAQRADRELDDTLRTRITGCYHSLLHACAHKHRHSPHLAPPAPALHALHAHAFPLHSVAPGPAPDTDPQTPDTGVHTPAAVALTIDSMAHIPDIDADTSDSDSKSDTCDTPVTDPRNLPNDAMG